MKGRKFHIATSVAGLIVVCALLVYYIMRDDLWKMPANLGFAAIIGLLVWRLVQGIKRKDE